MALMLSPSSVLLVIFAALLGCAAGFLQLIVKEKLAGRQITSSDDDELRPRAESSNALLQTPRSPGAVAVEKPQVTNREAKFFHGAMLRELMQKSSLSWLARTLEVETTVVFLFGFGMGVVWWVYWIPLHLLLYVLPAAFQYRQKLIASPALVIARHRNRPLALCRYLGLFALLIITMKPKDCDVLPIFSWASKICSWPMSSLPLADPNWPDLLLKQGLVWTRTGVSSMTGARNPTKIPKKQSIKHIKTPRLDKIWNDLCRSRLRLRRLLLDAACYELFGIPGSLSGERGAG